PDQKEQMRQWIKLFPRNLNKIRSLIHDEFGLKVSKQTIKRVLKSYRLIWHEVATL
ncbi:IS630 family transposase, partial [Candidatus Entotheonella serta]